MYKSFVSLVKFIPTCFILSDAILSGITVLISFSDCSALVHRNATDFYMLYPATLLNLLVPTVLIV